MAHQFGRIIHSMTWQGAFGNQRSAQPERPRNRCVPGPLDADGDSCGRGPRLVNL